LLVLCGRLSWLFVRERTHNIVYRIVSYRRSGRITAPNARSGRKRAREWGNRTERRALRRRGWESTRTQTLGQ